MPPSGGFLSYRKSMSRTQILQKQKIKAYRWLYEFTKSQCGDCAQTDCACKDTICAHVEAQARKNGHTLERTNHRLRFIGCSGCVVAPHLRETCTFYLCEKAQRAPGFQADRYLRLKQLCEKIELRLMSVE
jgi:hypothetical protein